MKDNTHRMHTQVLLCMSVFQFAMTDWLNETWKMAKFNGRSVPPYFLFLSAFLLSSTSFLFLHPHPRRHALRHTRTKKSTLDMKIRKVMIEFINSAVNQTDHSYRLK